MTCQPSGTELTYHSTREVVPVKNAFRDMLRLLRRAGGWSQREVAERLHINRSTYAYYETGRTRPEYETLSCTACRWISCWARTRLPPVSKRRFSCAFSACRRKNRPACCAIWRIWPIPQKRLDFSPFQSVTNTRRGGFPRRGNHGAIKNVMAGCCAVTQQPCDKVR